MDQAPTSLDPTQAANVYANHVVVNAYDTLYAYKYLARPYQLKPNLAADFPTVSADGLTYTIRIKQGVRFIDDPCFPDGRGRELVAEDLVYSIKRQFDPKNQPQGAWLWQGRIAGLDEWKAAGADYDQPGSRFASCRPIHHRDPPDPALSAACRYLCAGLLGNRSARGRRKVRQGARRAPGRFRALPPGQLRLFTRGDGAQSLLPAGTRRSARRRLRSRDAGTHGYRGDRRTLAALHRPARDRLHHRVQRRLGFLYQG